MIKHYPGTATYFLFLLETTNIEHHRNRKSPSYKHTHGSDNVNTPFTLNHPECLRSIYFRQLSLRDVNVLLNKLSISRNIFFSTSVFRS